MHISSNAILYILIAPVRYGFSIVAMIVASLLLGINWCLTGEYDHNEGLIGFLCAVVPAWVLDHVNNPLVHLHKSYKPAGWTFAKAVANHRMAIRWWADKAAHDYEYRNAARKNITKAANGWERKFWTIVDRHSKVLAEKAAAKLIIAP
jgi:hypothetical protein